MTALIDSILDVTLLPPAQKHPTIFLHFDALQPGEHLILHNDHDPKPLYYQLMAERGNVFSWKYLEEGPEHWRVMITKNQQEPDVLTVGQIAAEDYRKAMVFKRFGLDFCCGGKKSVQQACAEKGVDHHALEEALSNIDAIPKDRQLPYNSWTTDFLADYIVHTHHHYVRNTVPDLQFYADKVARVHGEHHPELLQVNKLVTALCQELISHMTKEERILFPYIRSLSAGDTRVHAAHFTGVQQPIHMMEMEHESAGAMLAEISTLTHTYTPPADACNSYRVFFSMLKAFEEDLHVHVHLENNILFPKALTLEQQISNS